MATIEGLSTGAEYKPKRDPFIWLVIREAGGMTMISTHTPSELELLLEISGAESQGIRKILIYRPSEKGEAFHYSDN